MSVTVRARLPKGDTNGLNALESTLAADPDSPVVIVAFVRPDTIESRPHDDNDPRRVKCTFLHVEAIDGGDADQAEKLLRNIYEQRTGKVTLPFEEDEDG